MVKQRTIRGVRDDIILLEGAEYVSEDSEFGLPVYRRILAVPDGGRITLSTTIQNQTTVPEVVVRAHGENARAKKDPAPGKGDQKGESVLCKLHYVGRFREQRLAVIEVSPVKYDKNNKTLAVATDLEISLEVESPIGPVVRNVGPLQGALNGIVLNSEAATSAGGIQISAKAGGPQATGPGSGQVCWASGTNWQDAATSVASCGADYLIVVADSLATSAYVDSLALCRASKNGFNVAIVKVSQVDASPDTVNTPIAIRSLIDSVYTTSSAAHMSDGRLGYVLLVGDGYDLSDSPMLPSYYGYANHAIVPTKENDKSRAADSYYSFLDDPVADLFPDVLIGRLPVGTHWEIANLVRKIVRYEPLSSAAWADSVLLVSGSDPGGFIFGNEQLSGFQNFFDSVLTYYPPTGRHVVELHRLAYPLPNDSTQQRIFGNKIAASMKRGKWLTAFFDHGSPFYWAGSFFARSYETFSTANGRPSIVFSIGSNTSHFDFTSNWGQEVMTSCDVGEGCMVPPPSSIQCESPGYQFLEKCDVVSERLLVQPGGAVAVIGYSRTQSTWYAQTDFTNLFRSIANQNPSSLGELLVGARMFNLDLTFNPVTARNLMLLGDPALDIRTRAPAAADTFDVAVGISDIGSSWGHT